MNQPPEPRPLPEGLPPKAIAENLKKLRKTSLRAVEEGSGVSNSLLCQIESGQVKNPTIETLLRLAKFYGVTVDSLLSEALPAPSVPETVTCDGCGRQKPSFGRCPKCGDCGLRLPDFPTPGKTEGVPVGMKACYRDYCEMFPWLVKISQGYDEWLLSDDDHAVSFRQGWANGAKAHPALETELAQLRAENERLRGGLKRIQEWTQCSDRNDLAQINTEAGIALLPAPPDVDGGGE